jgi:signal transduction histidine kinase
MHAPHNHAPPAAGEDLFAALRQVARDRAALAGPETAAGLELSLLQLQKLASLGKVTTVIAHDLGNLMTLLLGYSELLLSAVEQGQTPEREHLVELRRAAERASVMTTRLLGYSLPSADEPTALNLGLLIEGLVPMLGRLLGADASLEVRTVRETAAVMADARQVEQMALNLVLNARDARAGRVELTVEPVTVETPLPIAVLRPVKGPGPVPSGQYIRLRVRDNGGGMTAETLGRLFRPFFTTRTGGTGLGLAVVARVVRRANATVVIDSTPGGGTAVDIYFPQIGDAAAGTNERPH